MRHGFKVAVQVQYHIRIARQGLQGQTLRLQLGCRHLCGQRLAQVLADDLPVMLRVLGQQPFDFITDLHAQVQKVAVEVLSAFQLITPQRDVHDHLFQPDRVGHGHHHDFAAQATGAFEFGQVFFQMPRHQHAGQFIGMQ